MPMVTLGIALLLLQTENAPAPSAPIAGPTLTPRALTANACRPGGGEDDIVICGKNDPEQYRLRPLGPPPNGKPLPPMTARLGNGTVDLQATERSLPGAKGPAAMVTFKLPF